MKKLAYLILSTLLFVLIVLGILIATLNTDKGKNYITRFTEDLIAKNTGYTTKIIGFTIRFPCKIRLGYFSIADKSGECLTLEKAKITISLPSLLHKELKISSLEVANIVFSRIPQLSGNENSNYSDSMFDISIQNINLPSLLLGPKITNSDNSLKILLNGDLNYDSFQKLSFNLKAKTLESLNKFLKEMELAANGYYIISEKILNIKKSQITAEAFTLTGGGLIDLKGETVKAKYELTPNELKYFSKNFKGRVIDEINIQGTLKVPVIKGEIKTYDLNYLDKTLPNLVLDHELHYDTTTQIGSLKVSDKHNDVILNTDFNIKTDNIEINEFQLLYGQSSMSAKLNYNPKFNILNGNIKTHITDLHILSEFFDHEIKGELEFSLEFSSFHNVQSVDIDITSKPLSFDAFSVAQANAQATIEDLWNLKLNNINIKVNNLKYKEQLAFDKIFLTVKRKDDVLNFITQGHRNSTKELHIEASGNVKTIHNKNFTLNITNLKGKYGKNEVKGAKSITAEYQDNDLKYNITDLIMGSGKICSHGYIRKNELSSNTLLKQLPLSLLEINIPSEFSNSRLDGEINLIGKMSEPIIKTQLNISGINFIASEQAHFNLNLNYEKNLLAINSTIKSNDKSYGNLELKLPVQLSFQDYKAEFRNDEKIVGSLNLNLRIDPLASLFLPPIHRIKGQLDVNLKLGGSINNPQLNGSLNITEGKYEHAVAGIKIKNISSNILARGKTIIIQEFKTYDSGKSTLKGDGKWNLSQKNVPFEISLIANNFSFMNHPNIQATISGAIKVNGDAKQAKITGKIEPIPLDIQLPEQFKKDIPELNITKTILVLGDEEKINEPSFFDTYKVDMNIKLIAKHKIFIRGWGVDAELGGELVCKGLVNDPVIKGKLETIRGRYQEFGKQFVIKEGRLTFEGIIPPSPYLNIMGSITQDNTEIRVVLAGPILKPQLSIESNPSMPQEEALSILLFGKQTTQISPFQAVQLADSLRRLSGKGGGGINILDKARGILKVDDIRFKNDSDDAKNAALGIGKHLTDKVYLEIEKGAQAGTGKTRIEVEIRNNLSIESSVGESGANSVGINWRRDY